MSATGESTRRMRRDDLQVRELDGEAFVYDPKTADTHRLNETAWFIWCQCDGQHSDGDIMREMTEHYNVDLNDARVHVSRMMDEFEQRKLVTRVH